MLSAEFASGYVRGAPVVVFNVSAVKLFEFTKGCPLPIKTIGIQSGIYASSIPLPLRRHIHFMLKE